MRVTINENEITMLAETPHEQNALNILRDKTNIKVGTTDPWEQNDKRVSFHWAKDDWGL